MSEIKWIKLATDIFDDEKIKLIEAMPDADMLLIIWVKLLCQAGKANAGGYIFLSQNIPYTEEQLATIISRPVNTVRLALQLFQKFKMIEITDDGIFLPNWEKHQNIEGLERIREQTRQRVASYRERSKLALTQGNSVTLPNVTVTQQNRIDKDKDKEKNTTPISPSKGTDTILPSNDNDLLLPGITIRHAIDIATGKRGASETNRERCITALKKRGVDYEQLE